MTSEAPVETEEVLQSLPEGRLKRAAVLFKKRTNLFPWHFLPEATQDSWGMQVLEAVSGLSGKWHRHLKNNQKPVSLEQIHEALLQQMESHKKGFQKRLQPNDIKAVSNQLFQKRRNSSIVGVSSPAPRNKRVRTAGTLPTIEVAASSNVAAVATELVDQIELVLDPALSQTPVSTPTHDETEAGRSAPPPQLPPASKAPSQTREPTQPFRLDTRDPTTKTSIEKIKDFLTESGTHPDRSQSLPPTDSKCVGVPNPASLHDLMEFSLIRPFDLLPARYKDVHHQYSTALQHAKTQSKHGLAVLQKQLEEAHHAAGEFENKIKEAVLKKDAAVDKVTEIKKNIELTQDFLASSRRLSQHSSVLGLEEILAQQRNIHSQLEKALKEAEKTANEAASKKSTAETRLNEAKNKVTKLKEVTEAKKGSAVVLDSESEHAIRVAKLGMVGSKGSQALQDMFPVFFQRLDEMIQESTEVDMLW